MSTNKAHVHLPSRKENSHNQSVAIATQVEHPAVTTNVVSRAVKSSHGCSVFPIGRLYSIKPVQYVSCYIGM